MGFVDPTLGLSFYQLQCDVAEYLGNYTLDGSGIVAPPTNPYELDKVKRCVNDGYRRVHLANARWNVLNIPFSITFAGSAIPNGPPIPLISLVTGGSSTSLTDSTLAGLYADNYFAGWGCTITHADTALDELLCVSSVGSTGQIVFQTNVGTMSTSLLETPVAGESYQMLPMTTMPQSPAVYGQTWRYLMPPDFSGTLIEPFTYNTPTPRIKLDETNEAQIRSLYATTRTSGIPVMYAFRQLATNQYTQGGRWEVIWWPMPGGIYTVTGRYKRMAQAMVNNTDRSVFGPQLDEVVKKAALAEAEQQFNDRTAERAAAYAEALAQAIAIDARSNPGMETDYGDQSESRMETSGRLPGQFYHLNTYNGVQVP